MLLGCGLIWELDTGQENIHTHKAISVAISPFRKIPQCKFGSGSAEAGHGINSETEKTFFFFFFEMTTLDLIRRKQLRRDT